MNYRTVLAIFVNSIVICLLVFLLYKLTAQPKTKVVEDGKYWTVETKLGQIRGIRKTSLLNNIDFYAFRGVPYAKSPTGELRFKVNIFNMLMKWMVLIENIFAKKRHLNQLNHGNQKC